MSSIVYSAIGTANLGFKPLDFKSASLDPQVKDKVGSWFISTNDPALTETQKEADKANPQSLQFRAQLLKEMGLAENDITSMSAVSQNTLNNNIAKVVHERLMASGQTQGAYVNTLA